MALLSDKATTVGVPDASPTQDGLVTTGTQSFAGDKSFNTSLRAGISTAPSATSDTVKIESNSGSRYYSLGLEVNTGTDLHLRDTIGGTRMLLDYLGNFDFQGGELATTGKIRAGGTGSTTATINLDPTSDTNGYILHAEDTGGGNLWNVRTDNDGDCFLQLYDNTHVDQVLLNAQSGATSWFKSGALAIGQTSVGVGMKLHVLGSGRFSAGGSDHFINIDSTNKLLTINCVAGSGSTSATQAVEIYTRNGEYISGTTAPDSTHDAQMIRLRNTAPSSGDGYSGISFATSGNGSPTQDPVWMIGGSSGGGSGGYLAWGNDSSERMRLTGGGTLSLGTSTPDTNAKFDVRSGSGGTIHLVRTDATTIIGESLGRIAFSSTDSNTPAMSTPDALIDVQADVAHDAGNHGTRMMFYTKANSGNPGTAPTERMRINNAGQVRVFNLGVSLDVQTDSNGYLTTSSDARLKNDLGVLQSGTEAIMALQPKFYTWKEGPEGAQQELGFMAQEVAPYIPEAAPYDEEKDEWGFNTRAVVATLVKAYQELRNEFEDYKNNN